MGNKQQKGSKAKKRTQADALIKGARKAGVELTEKDLDKVSGGALNAYLKIK